MTMKRGAILGSTGSIGVNALNVIREMPADLRVVALAAHSNSKLVAEQARARDQWFDAIADLTVDTGREPVDRVVARVLASAGERGLGV